MSFVFVCIGFLSALNGWSQVAVRVPDEVEDAQDITEINGNLWLATPTGAYKVVNGHSTRVFDQEVEVNNIEPAGTTVWFATTIGAFKLADGRTQRIPDKILDVWTLKVLPDNRVCLGTANGAYLVTDTATTEIGPVDAVVSRVEYLNDELWLGTSKGAYRVSSRNKLEHIPDEQIDVSDISSLQGSIWVASSKGAYRVTKNASPKLYVPGLNVQKVSEANGVIWFATNKGAYRLVDEKPERNPDIEMAVEEVVGIDDTVWIASNQGAYKIAEHEQAQMVTEPATAIKTIAKLKNQVWLGGYHGAFLLRDNHVSRVPDVDLQVQSFHLIDGTAWMATTLGAYRLDTASIAASVISPGSWWKDVLEKITGVPIIVSGDVSVKVNYVGSDGQVLAAPELRQPDFRVIVERDKSALRHAISENEYAPISSYRKNISFGNYVLFIGVHDKWGNIFEKSLPVFVIPGPMLTAIVVPLTWIVVLGCCILFAPANELANDLLMNPWLRMVSSFGLIPLAMTIVPTARRHILKRYVRKIAGEREFAEWLVRYELPGEEFSSKRFVTRIAEDRTLFVTGQSGIGKTSYLKFLTATYATSLCSRLKDASLSLGASNGADPGERPLTGFQGIVPIFVPLLRYRGQKVDDMVAGQLASYGRLTDKQLVSWYVDQGGFLFLLDGLNEVDESMRNDVSRFVDQVRHRNYCCISSQVSYPPFAWITELKLAYLSRENIRRILHARFGEGRVAQVLGQFTEETFEVYKVPQDIEFLIQAARDCPNLTVPQSKGQLYEGIFGSIFAGWQQEGHADYADLLTKRAYDMVLSKEPLLNNLTVQLSPEFTNPLTARKVLVQRDNGYYFQHNLVRDYLASIWLRDRWRPVFADQTIVMDSNWLEMLKFVLGALKEANLCRDLVWTVLERNRQLAGGLFTWLDHSRPEMTKQWSDEFKVAFAEFLLQRR